MLLLPAAATLVLVLAAARLGADRDIGTGRIPARDSADPSFRLLSTPELEALTRELGLAAAVDFVGWVADAADFLHGLDLFVLPSRVEPFGLVVAESMAAGAPIVATGIDGPKEILQDGALGTLCAPDDPAALAAAVAAAAADWPSSLNKARAAQAYAQAHFSLEAGRARLTATLDAIMAGG